MPRDRDKPDITRHPLYRLTVTAASLAAALAAFYYWHIVPSDPSATAERNAKAAEREAYHRNLWDQRDKLANMVRAAGYACQTPHAVTPFAFSEGLSLDCDSYRYRYEITNQGGNWQVTAK